MSIHLYSLLPLTSRKSTSLPRLCPACTHGLTSSPGIGSQPGALLAPGRRCSMSRGQRLGDTRNPRGTPGERWRPADRAARGGRCPPLPVAAGTAELPLHPLATHKPGLTRPRAVETPCSGIPAFRMQLCRELGRAPNV